MDTFVLLIFLGVYLGMMLGRFPGLALDRTGVALLGAIALLAGGKVTPQAAWDAIDVPTISLLLGLMVVSAQFRLGGFYSEITHRIAAAEVSPDRLLALLIAAVALLSALLANDVVCLAVAPLLVDGCARRNLRPVPFLLGMACAANIGSAATLIGNPQNMLIGQKLHLSFSGYLLDGGVPAVLGCVACWWVIRWRVGDQWHQASTPLVVEAPPFNRWQTGKGLVILTALMGAFLLTDLPRDVTALGAAGLLLSSRRMHTRDMLGLVDWQLLVLFCGLFVVNHTLAATGMAQAGLDGLASAGVPLGHPPWLFGFTVVLSNLVSNVPAVMLLLPAAGHPNAGAILALASTLAGNLIIVGSIANIIVVDQASRLGVAISWREHARIGIPVTVVTLLIAAGWLALRA